MNAKLAKQLERMTDELSQMMPFGWNKMFETTKVGKHMGLRVKCPHCDAIPPRDLKYGHRRWRWMSAHIAKHNRGK